MPSGPFLFLAINILPELETLSSIVLETEKIKSAENEENSSVDIESSKDESKSEVVVEESSKDESKSKVMDSSTAEL